MKNFSKVLSLLVMGCIMFSSNAYAHNPELTEMENEMSHANRVNLTSKMWQNLADLYAEDVQYHRSRKELEEANKASYLESEARLTAFGILVFFNRSRPIKEDVEIFTSYIEDHINQNYHFSDQVHRKLHSLDTILDDIYNYAPKDKGPGSEGFYLASQIAKMQSYIMSKVGDKKSEKFYTNQSEQFMRLSDSCKSDEQLLDKNLMNFNINKKLWSLAVLKLGQTIQIYVLWIFQFKLRKFDVDFAMGIALLILTSLSGIQIVVLP